MVEKNKSKKGNEKEKKVKKSLSEEDEEIGEGKFDEGESEEVLEQDIKNAEEELKKLQNVLSDVGDGDIRGVAVKGSKNISQLKKGDKIKVDGKEYEVDAHYILIDHGKTKEMVIELFDHKTDQDYQLRYFSDQVETSMEFYVLQEIVYVKKLCKRVEW